MFRTRHSDDCTAGTSSREQWSCDCRFIGACVATAAAVAVRILEIAAHSRAAAGNDVARGVGTMSTNLARTRAIAGTDVPQLVMGMALIAFWWPVAWTQLRPLSDYSFFPLWLGYILTVDGI